MRRLHPVGIKERFVAQGEYRYKRADGWLGISERWSIHEVGAGGLLYRVDEDGREEDGLSILSEALISPAGQFERFNVQSFSSKDPEIKLFKADYSFEPGNVLIGRKLPGQDRAYEDFPLMVDCVIYIKQTVYMGLTIAHVVANNNKAHVFAPQLLSIQDAQMQKIITRDLGTETLQVGKLEIEARKFQIADDVFYWIDQHGIPLRREYTYDDASYTVTLHNYAHR